MISHRNVSPEQMKAGDVFVRPGPGAWSWVVFRVTALDAGPDAPSGDFIISADTKRRAKEIAREEVSGDQRAFMFESWTSDEYEEL